MYTHTHKKKDVAPIQFAYWAENHLCERIQQFTTFLSNEFLIAMERKKWLSWWNQQQQQNWAIPKNWLKLSQNWCIFTYLINTRCDCRIWAISLKIAWNNLHETCKTIYRFFAPSFFWIGFWMFYTIASVWWTDDGITLTIKRRSAFCRFVARMESKLHGWRSWGSKCHFKWWSL